MVGEFSVKKFSRRSWAGGAGRVLTLASSLLLGGCALSAYQNEPLHPVPKPTRASFNVQDTQGNKRVLVAMAFSGGGSRAAYFAASVMLRLQSVYCDEDLMDQVDVISCVSGGALPAAYFCISQDPDGPEMRSKRVWDAETVRDLFSRSFQARWIGNSFLPSNIVRYFFTAYDRSDIMAQTLEDNLYDTLPWGDPLTFADMNPSRPYLIINSTNATGNSGGECGFGTVFTFTDEDFKNRLRSELSTYYVAWAVMASCTFPGFFNYMTLRDFRDDSKERYLHLFDGGTTDNLGLESVKKLILLSKFFEDTPKYDHYVVILVDSFVDGSGADGTDYDPRSLISNFYDTNVIDAFNVLMAGQREDLLGQFRSGILDMDQDRKVALDNLTFWHINLLGVPAEAKDQDGESLRDSLNRIPTQFSISSDDMDRIDQAVKLLVAPDNPTLVKIVQLLFPADT